MAARTVPVPGPGTTRPMSQPPASRSGTSTMSCSRSKATTNVATVNGLASWASTTARLIPQPMISQPGDQRRTNQRLCTVCGSASGASLTRRSRHRSWRPTSSAARPAGGDQSHGIAMVGGEQLAVHAQARAGSRRRRARGGSPSRRGTDPWPPATRPPPRCRRRSRPRRARRGSGTPVHRRDALQPSTQAIGSVAVRCGRVASSASENDLASTPSTCNWTGGTRDRRRARPPRPRSPCGSRGTPACRCRGGVARAAPVDAAERASAHWGGHCHQQRRSRSGRTEEATPAGAHRPRLATGRRSATREIVAFAPMCTMSAPMTTNDTA